MKATRAKPFGPFDHWQGRRDGGRALARVFRFRNGYALPSAAPPSPLPTMNYHHSYMLVYLFREVEFYRPRRRWILV